MTAGVGERGTDGRFLAGEVATLANSFACFRASSRHDLNSCFFVAVKSLISACIASRLWSTAASNVSCICGGILVFASSLASFVFGRTTPNTSEYVGCARNSFYTVVSGVKMLKRSEAMYLINCIHYGNNARLIKIGQTLNSFEPRDIRSATYTIQYTPIVFP